MKKKRRQHNAAAAYADGRVGDALAFLAGNAKVKEQIAQKWLDMEMNKPRTQARLTGVDKLPERIIQ